MATLTIKTKYPSLNDYIAAINISRYVGNAMKQKYTNITRMECLAQKIPKFDYIDIVYHWVEENRKRDKDNICFAKKFINDGMVKAKVIPNDGWKNIHGFSDTFEIGDFTGVIIEITEVI